MRTDTLKSCDILLYRGTSLTSRLIRWGTGSLYSHVAVVVEPGMNLAIESNTGRQSGVRALDLRALADHGVDAFRVKNEFSFKAAKVISHLVSRLGARYDTAGVLALGAMKAVSFLTGFKRFKVFNRFQKERDYFCSELVYEAFDRGGLDIVPDVDLAEVTSPGDIARSPRVAPVGLSGEAARPA